MSEYTKYFIIKSSSENEVKQKLNDAKIHSIVDSDKERYWFMDEYKHKDLNWIVVDAPPDSGFEDGSFYYRDKFEELSKIFNTVIFFFEEENANEWQIQIKNNAVLFSKDFYNGKLIEFTEREKFIIADVFECEFNTIERFLKPGKSANFLNFNGIPYMQMNNQDHSTHEIINGNYSILSSELIG